MTDHESNESERLMTTPPILPVALSDVSTVFPADALEYMPAYETIPEEFRDHYNEWVRFQMTWFSQGLTKRFSFEPAEGVDASMAFRQLSAIQGSFAPKHEHKVAAVAYLSSLWMRSMIYGPPDCTEDELIALGEVGKEEWLEYFAGADR